MTHQTELERYTKFLDALGVSYSEDYVVEEWAALNYVFVFKDGYVGAVSHTVFYASDQSYMGTYR